MPSPVKIQVEVSDDGAVKGLKVIAKGVDDFVNETKLKLNQPVSEGAGGISGYVDHLSDKLREHGKEHVQTARSVRRFTAELEGLIGPGNEATKMLGGLLGGFAIGGPIGVAIEGVKLLVEHIKEAGEKEEKAKEAGEEWFKALEKRGSEAGKALETLADKIDHVTQAQKFERDIAPMTAQIDHLNEKLAEEKHAIAELESLNLSQAMLNDNKEYREAQKHVAELTRQLNALQETRAKVMAQANASEAERASANERDATNKRLDADEQGRKQEDAARQKAREKAKADAEKDAAAAAEAARKERALRLQVIGEQYDAQHAAQLKAAEDLTRAEIAAQQNVFPAQEKALSALEFAELSVVYRVQSEWRRGINAILQGHMSLRQGISGIWSEIENAATSSIANILTTFLAAEAEKLVMSKAGKSSEILGDAEQAAAATYANVAKIPYVGPFLAPPAAAAAFAAVMAFDSAEGGWNIPMGLNPVVQAHQGEHILPKEIAQRYEAGAPGRTSNTTVNVRAFDSRDVVSTLRSLKRKGRI